MNWLVYWEPDDIEFAWFKTEVEARQKVQQLITKCEEASADAERNLHWEITLCKVTGLVSQTPAGLVLKPMPSQ